MIKLDPIKEIKKFSFSSSGLEGILGESIVGGEIKFPPRATKQIILIKDGENQISFSLIYYGDEIKHFRLQEGEFSREDLQQIGEKFNINIVSHKLHPSILTGSLGFKNEEYDVRCFGALTECKDNSYLLIYAKRGSTIFEDDIVYVHGIWRVKSN